MDLNLSTLFSLNLLAGQSPALDGVIVFFAQYVPYLVAALFVAFAVSRIVPQKEKLILFGEGFGAALIARFGFVELIRAFVHRSRPFVDHAITELLSETSFSFPSGHAAFFFALSMVVYAYNKRWGWVFFLVSALIGLARIAAGVHYPSDILGGAALGVAVGYIVVRICRHLMSTNV